MKAADEAHQADQWGELGLKSRVVHMSSLVMILPPFCQQSIDTFEDKKYFPFSERITVLDQS